MGSAGAISKSTPKCAFQGTVNSLYIHIINSTLQCYAALYIVLKSLCVLTARVKTILDSGLTRTHIISSLHFTSNPRFKHTSLLILNRLNGKLMGVFGTRTPHRPNPIGLSVAMIGRISGREIELLGADIVDGTPVLDIKPYVPFCDSHASAETPFWVNSKDDIGEALHVRFEKQIRL